MKEEIFKLSSSLFLSFIKMYVHQLLSHWMAILSTHMASFFVFTFLVTCMIIDKALSLSHLT
jgi:hypothetical protein